MIVEWRDLPNLVGRVVMVDGSFDPLHDGHIAYFAAAVNFGYPVLCNITSDAWTVTKHPVLLPQQSRATVIDAIRHVSYVHCSESTTRDVLERVCPIFYVKGNDWLARGGIPKEEAGTCSRLGIKIAYVDTVLNSSTHLINHFRGM